MPNYKTPGVYVEEIPRLPGSIVAVPTAIPAFVGYTEYARDEAGASLQAPVRIRSLQDYHQYFGRGYTPVEYLVDNTGGILNGVDIPKRFYLYDSIRLFYDNGGGTCYIVSVGNYEEAIIHEGPGKIGLKDGLTILAKWDEPTLLLCPDAVGLKDGNNPGFALLGQWQKQALSQCEDLKDRFVIMDIMAGDEKEATSGTTTKATADWFREHVGINFLLYGAAYHPWLQTIFSYEVKYYQLAFSGPAPDAAVVNGWKEEIENWISVLYGTLSTDLEWTPAETTEYFGPSDNPPVRKALFIRRKQFQQLYELFYQNLRNKLIESPTDDNRDKVLSLLDKVLGAFDTYRSGTTNEYMQAIAAGYENDTNWTSARARLAGPNAIDRDRDGLLVLAELENSQTPAIILAYLSNLLAKAITFETSAESALFTQNPTYSRIFAEIIRQRRAMPPSGAIAGVYSQVDRSRGVSKAPANVSLNGISGPALLIDDEDQADLNVHVSGKSINVIRSFVNKGTLVWGARTLAGNDNEWRYVSVRRLFIFVEESIKRALEPFVFEANDVNTWIRVRGMISNFLSQQWKAGALFGSRPEDAYFVHIGLGETMTQNDIWEGRMIVEIGMAAVRPAEFIILRFSHKMQDA